MVAGSIAAAVSADSECGAACHPVHTSPSTDDADRYVLAKRLYYPTQLHTGKRLTRVKPATNNPHDTSHEVQSMRFSSDLS